MINSNNEQVIKQSSHFFPGITNAGNSTKYTQKAMLERRCRCSNKTSQIISKTMTIAIDNCTPVPY